MNRIILAFDEWFSGRYKVRLADKTPVAISELHKDYLRYTVEHNKRAEKKRALVQYLRKYRQVLVQRHRGVDQYAVGIVRKAEIASTVQASATPTAKTVRRTRVGHQTIQAIETRYKGYRFRSRLEARWAVFFDHLGIEWEYEPQGYVLRDGSTYLPDFWLPKFDDGMYVEVKPDGGDFLKAMQFAYDLRVNILQAKGMPGETYYEVFKCSDFLEKGICIEHAFPGFYTFEIVDSSDCREEALQSVFRTAIRAVEGSLFSKAIFAARSARFEHGENGAA